MEAGDSVLPALSAAAPTAWRSRGVAELDLARSSSRRFRRRSISASSSIGSGSWKSGSGDGSFVVSLHRG